MKDVIINITSNIKTLLENQKSDYNGVDIKLNGETYTLVKKQAPKYKIGDELHGGIIFHIDETGEHGLISAKSDYFTKLTWNDAMKIFPQGEWRLPTKEELNLLYNQKDIVCCFVNGLYWYSSEPNCYTFSNQILFSCYNKGNNTLPKNYVRAVRAF